MRSICPVTSSLDLSLRSRPDARFDAFRAFVADPTFPCVGARSALNRQRMEFGAYGTLGDATAAERLCADLGAFSGKYTSPGSDPVSFVAMFDCELRSEREFVNALWRQLQLMHSVDAPVHGWDPSVSADPNDHGFSFSIAGRAFFVVGLSPNASRLARRAPFPCLVFNFHEQFEEMKANGKYAGLQRVIRARDIALQGDINPSLAKFGDASEARQYGGDATHADWVCPFKPQLPAHAG